MEKIEFYEKYIKFIFENIVDLKNYKNLVLTMNINDELEDVIYKYLRDKGLVNKLVLVKNDLVGKRKYLLEHDIEYINNSDEFINDVYGKYAFHNAYYLEILDGDDLGSDIPVDRLLAFGKKNVKKNQIYFGLKQMGKINWTFVFIPCEKYMEKMVFSYDLFNDIYLLDGGYDKTRERLMYINNYLNSIKFNKYHIVNELGTDLFIGIRSNSNWLNIYNFLVKDKNIITNYPSYENFITPDCYDVNGVVYNSHPLYFNNKKIDNFYLKFEDGRVIDFDAEEGKDVLESIINRDLGSCYLGEFSIVEENTPICNKEITFNHVLLDENACSHLALGKAYIEGVDGVEGLDIELYSKNGVNFSELHVDFMYGNKSTKVYGIKGLEEVLIFDKGKFLK